MLPIYWNFFFSDVLIQVKLGFQNTSQSSKKISYEESEAEVHELKRKCTELRAELGQKQETIADQVVQIQNL